MLFRLTENSILIDEISKKTWNEEHNKLFLVKIQLQEVARRRCYKEENGLTRHKLNEYSMQDDQESRTVSLLRVRLEFIEDSKIFQDPDSPSSSGSTHVSHQALVPSSSKKPSRESRM